MARHSLALVVDWTPPWLVANFEASREHLDFSVIELDPDGSPTAADASFPRHRVRLEPHETDRRIAAARMIDAVNPDAVLTLGWNGEKNLIGLGWALRRGRPAIVASDSKSDDFPRHVLREAAKSQVVRLFTAGWAAGQRAADYLADLGLPRDRIITGPVDTVDVAHFERGANVARADQALRARLGLPKQYFLTVSRLSPEKNLAAFVRTYAAYRRRAGADAWGLVIVGEGPSRPEIEAAIRETGVSDLAVLPGWTSYEDLPAFYGLADAFVHPTLKDTWACVVNEAASAGLPLLVSLRAGCAPDLVHQGRNGFAFDPTDASTLANLMFDVAHGSVDRAALGRASSEVINHWRPESYALSLASVCELALKVGARPRPATAAGLDLWAALGSRGR